MYIMFQSVKDSSLAYDNYENTLSQLAAEVPQVKKSIEKLEETLAAFQKLINESLKGNPNYDEEFRNKDE